MVKQHVHVFQARMLFLHISTTTPNLKSIKKVTVYSSCLF